jgi:NitT/TauT family transport system permease protein
MNMAVKELTMQQSAVEPEKKRRPLAAPAPMVSAPISTVLAVPAASAIAFAVHYWCGDKEPIPEPRYFIFLGFLFGFGLLLAVLQRISGRVRSWAMEMSPIIAAGILFLALWETVTAGFRLLPLPYFPGPASVYKGLIEDWKLLGNSAAHSLWLLLRGYALGVFVGITTGVYIGWFARARYWGMPILKIVGPIPATAWIPLAMVIAPRGYSAVGIVALAVWFPVTMLTMSGIANTRAAYLDVARTLGADQKFLIFRVAIPAAMPNIFLGLFMGLGTSFLTLIVAETVGVKAGLGWYVAWAQGWAEYGKVYAALVIMAAFFSTIMTALFKIRDRVLVWQKGTIKW